MTAVHSVSSTSSRSGFDRERFLKFLSDLKKAEIISGPLHEIVAGSVRVFDDRGKIFEGEWAETVFVEAQGFLRRLHFSGRKNEAEAFLKKVDEVFPDARAALQLPFRFARVRGGEGAVQGAEIFFYAVLAARHKPELIRRFN